MGAYFLFASEFCLTCVLNGRRKKINNSNDAYQSKGGKRVAFDIFINNVRCSADSTLFMKDNSKLEAYPPGSWNTEMTHKHRTCRSFESKFFKLSQGKICPVILKIQQTASLSYSGRRCNANSQESADASSDTK